MIGVAIVRSEKVKGARRCLIETDRQTDQKRKRGGRGASTHFRIQLSPPAPPPPFVNGHHRRPEGHPRPPARKRLHRIVECGSLLPTSTVERRRRWRWRYECGTTSDRLPQVDMLPPVSVIRWRVSPLLVLEYIILYIIMVNQHRL